MATRGVGVGVGVAGFSSSNRPPPNLLHPFFSHLCVPNLTPLPLSAIQSKPLRSFAGTSKLKDKKWRLGRWEPPYDGEEEEEEEEMEGEQEEGILYLRDSEKQPSVSTNRQNESTQNQILEKQKMEFIREVERLLDPEEKEILLANVSPDISKLSSVKWSVFHTFAMSHQIAFMDELLFDGHDINAVDQNGLTALHRAIMVKKEAVVTHLLRAGADPHVKDGDGASLLHYAIQVGSSHITKLLIKYHIDVNVADDEGWTPLHLAVQSRNRDIAKVLLINGADKTRKTKSGKTALDLSFCFGKDFKSYDLAKLLKLVPAGLDC